MYLKFYLLFNTYDLDLNNKDYFYIGESFYHNFSFIHKVFWIQLIKANFWANLFYSLRTRFLQFNVYIVFTIYSTSFQTYQLSYEWKIYFEDLKQESDEPAYGIFRLMFKCLNFNELLFNHSRRVHSTLRVVSLAEEYSVWF